MDQLHILKTWELILTLFYNKTNIYNFLRLLMHFYIILLIINKIFKKINILIHILMHHYGELIVYLQKYKQDY